MTPHVLLRLQTFYHFDLKFFPAYLISLWFSKGLLKKVLLNLLNNKHNIWKVIKDGLLLKRLLKSYLSNNFYVEPLTVIPAS